MAPYGKVWNRLSNFAWLILYVCILVTWQPLYSQIGASIPVSSKKYIPKWKVVSFDHRLFIENKGQFNGDVKTTDKIYFQAILGNVKAYFTLKGIIYRYDEFPKSGAKDDDDNDKEIVQPIVHYVSTIWEGANSNATIDTSGQQLNYYTYGSDKEKNIKAYLFKKITYRNLYPGIDIEYFFPTGKEGIKYDIVVHPGANLSKLKLKYEGIHTDMHLDENGNAVVATDIGIFEDHAPVAYYQNGEKIESSYKLSGIDESFTLTEGYDKNKIIIIDPWTTDPLFSGVDKAYDVDYDYAGNVYVYGGHNNFQLAKFDNAGNPQWTYITPPSGTPFNQQWYGDFVVDKVTGQCYVAEAVDAGCNVRGVEYLQVNAAGALTGTYKFPEGPGICTNAMSEIWRMAYSPCTGQIVIGGGGVEMPLQTAMLDKTMTSSTPVNSLAAPDAFHDVNAMAIDPDGTKVYMAFAQNTGSPGSFPNVLVSLPLPSLAPASYIVSDGYNFQELTSIKYVSQGTNAMNGMVASPNWLYMYDGATLKQFNKTTGGLNAGSLNNISSTPFMWGGLDVDNCDNTYVGVGNSIKIYNSSLTNTGTITIGGTDTVFDVVLSADQATLYTCGHGFVEAITIPSPGTFASMSATPATCGSCNGTATATLMQCGSSVSSGVTYSWNDGQTTQTAIGLCAGTYTATVSLNSACPSVIYTSTVSVTGGGGGPTVIVSAAPTTICSGSSSTLTASGATSYLWNTGATTSGIIVSPTTSTTYSVTGTTAGCTGTPQTVVVTVSPTPTVVVSATPPTICSGNSTIVSASGATTYSWNTGATTSAINVSPASTTTYTVTGSSGGCPDIPQTIIINVTPIPTINVTPISASICVGDTAFLSASGATSYRWSPTGGLSCTSCFNPAADPGSTITYTVTGTLSGCTGKDSVVITVNPTPTLTVIPVNPTICPGGNVILTGGGGVSYTWSPAGSLSASTGTSVTATPGSTTTYTVIGTNINGCKDSAKAVVTVSPPPSISISITGISPAICASDTVGMIASGAGAGGTYTWSPAAGLNTTTGVHVIAQPGATTTYTVTGTTAGGCIGTATQVVTIYPTPTVTVVPVTPNICSGSSTVINASGGVSYTWSPATGLSATTGASVTATPTVTTTYTVTGKNINGCPDSTKTVITVTAPPVVSVAPTTPAICSSGNVNLTASGATNYTWSPGTGLSATTGATVNATPTVTTTYTVTGTTGSCRDTQSVVITVSSALSVTVTPSAPILCTGGNVTLNAGGAASFTWSPATGLSCVTCPNPVATPTVTTTYKVVGSSGSCADSATVTITVDSMPTVKVNTGQPSICNGSSAIINASGATNYTWNPGTGLSATTGATVTASPSTTLTYTVYGSNAGGCSDSAMIVITVNVTPTVTISSSGSDSLCQGQSITLTANGGAGTYLWSNGATTSSITVTPSGTTLYSVVDSNGVCAGSASQNIFVYPPFVLTMRGDSICIGNNATVTVNASGGKPGYSYSWNNGTTGTNIIAVSPAGSTYYECSVTDGCGDVSKDSAMVYTFATPKALFTPTPDTIQAGQYVSFVNKSTGTTNYYWTFGNEGSSTDVNPYYQYTIPGDYIVTLTASNGGCKDSVSDTVFVLQSIYIPNVFTPNNDGINDVFHVTMGGMKTYYIEIFNRWGERLFMADSPNIDWDGRSSAGVDESDGIYYYVIKAADYTGKQYNYQGYLQLIRGN